MAVTFKYEMYPGGWIEENVEEFVVSEIDGDDYDRSSAEACRATADNAAEVLGRLISVLKGKGVLNDLQIDHILKVL